MEHQISLRNINESFGKVKRFGRKNVFPVSKNYLDRTLEDAYIKISFFAAYAHKNFQI